jgi:hypothetical protein
MRTSVLAGGALALATAACSPTFDWRETRPEGAAGLQAMFPCRPASHARRVTLAGAPVEMTMLACTAGQITFALTHADVADPALVEPALRELARSAGEHLRPAGSSASAPSAAARPGAAVSQPVLVPGMTPQPQAARWRLAGQLPDGRAVQEELALFAKGTRVVQATMLGPRLDEAAREGFFGGLRFAP